MVKDQFACLAMVLAGGEGKRLGALTERIAKPAVYFGGQYRLIDFPLSNCIHSDIHCIGVVTQYQSASLQHYIGDGRAWLKSRNGMIKLLPADETKPYSGTADAIYQNRTFMNQHQAEHVLILSGDHIYRMDYQRMLEQHIAAGADATIAVKQVAWHEAHRFGIVETDAKHCVTSFEEKPAMPRSNLASMGIYLFRKEVLQHFLQRDARNPHSSHDFGHDVLPLMLAQGCHLVTHPFEGYWRDVGTVKSLWESHMDLLQDPPLFTSHEPSWPIYSAATYEGWQDTITDADRQLLQESNSLIHRHCAVLGSVDRSVVFAGAEIAEGAHIEYSIIMPHAYVGPGAYISHAIVGEGCCIDAGAVIRGQLSPEVVVLGENMPELSYQAEMVPLEVMQGVHAESLQSMPHIERAALQS